MKKNVVRLGDPTIHCGSVIAASLGRTVDGTHKMSQAIKETF